MANVFQLMPGLEGEEMAYIQELIKDMSDEKAQQFAMSYMSRRKDPTNILIFAVIGFVVSRIYYADRKVSLLFFQKVLIRDDHHH